jgi:putative resolvase
MKRKLVKIGEAARMLGTSPAQLRKWDVSGDLRPARRTRGGTRYYAVADLVSTAPGVVADDAVTVCYA